MPNHSHKKIKFITQVILVPIVINVWPFFSTFYPLNSAVLAHLTWNCKARCSWWSYISSIKMISLKHFWACGYVSTSIFSRKVKKGPILAIFWQFLPPNFCKLSPHKFSETLLLKKIYMICTIRDHSTFFIPVTIFEKSHFFRFFWVFKPNLPLTDTS